MVAIEASEKDAQQKKIRTIAFYLTQFHPVPENDEWWGKGFTEWTNVTKAAPLFDGHYQPHLPTDFGFYDLRLRETRRDQIAVAKQYGIDGFCYHYYWFSGRRLLEAPFQDMLADPQSDMPFCICWANENWTRRWDAAEHQILIAQKYLPDDDLNFIKDLLPVLRDQRYIRVDGAPLIMVYRPQHLPNARKTAEVWREYCRSVGIPKIVIYAGMTHGNWDYEQFGFDGGIEFPPHNYSGSAILDIRFRDAFHGVVVQFEEVASMHLAREYGPKYNVMRTVFPAWDNTARRGANAFVVANGTPGNYEYWLSQSIERTRHEFPGSERLVFVNAWNEWAEGCHLEPDRLYGHGFLEAHQRAVSGRSVLKAFPDTRSPQRSVRGSPDDERLVHDVGVVLAHHGRKYRQTMGAASISFMRRIGRVLFAPFPNAKRQLVKVYLRVFG